MLEKRRNDIIGTVTLHQQPRQNPRNLSPQHRSDESNPEHHYPEKPQRLKRHAPDPGLSQAYIERMTLLNEQLLAGGEASRGIGPLFPGGAP